MKNDVAAKKAACQVGSGPLVRATHKAEMKNGGGESFVPVEQVSLTEIGLRKRKQITVRQRLKHLRRLGQSICNRKELRDGVVP